LSFLARNSGGIPVGPNGDGSDFLPSFVFNPHEQSAKMKMTTTDLGARIRKKSAGG